VAQPKRRSLGALFALLTLGFAAMAVWSGAAGQWIFLAVSAILAVWMAELTVRFVR